MSTIIILLLIWCAIAFLYSKIKGLSFWEGNKALWSSLVGFAGKEKEKKIKEYKRKNK